MPDDPDKSATNPNAVAAHVLLTEIRTRIATQRLHFSQGDEKTALSSLHALYGVARKTITDHFGCDAFAEKTVAFLNGDLRHFMADWHRKSLNGELDTRDGAVAFRCELHDIQNAFREFAADLHKMAYGTDLGEFPDDPEPFEPPSGHISFGIPQDGSIPFDPRQPRDHIVDLINRDEAAAITARRKTVNHPDADATQISDAAGLALSGGGIRSASFCLGVVQVLADMPKLMNNFDIMSTVSGGGFTGAFLTQRIAAEGVEAVARPDGPDTPAIKYLRQRADYLNTGSLQITAAVIVNLLLGMILNWTALAAVIAVLALGVHLLQWVIGGSVGNLVSISVGLAVAGIIAYAWLPYRLGRWRVVALWALCGGAAAAFVTHLVGYFYGLFVAALTSDTSGVVPVTFSVATLAATLPALSRLLPVLGQPWMRKIGNQIVLIIATAAVPVLALLFGYALYWLGTISTDGVAQFMPDWLTVPGWVLLFAIALFLSLTALVCIDINATGPHWLYRQQLANTFIKKKPDDTPDVPLKDHDPDQKAPYLLVNAVAQLPNSTAIQLRERRGDFFLFSKYWCGSPLTGYRPTKHWKRGAEDIDLATAIATSGAAVAPHMALLSVSAARSLLSFLNIRLGYWVKRPPVQDQPLGSGGRPGARMLLRETFGFGMHENSDWLMLTDGAHLDNSAIYELLRRRCKFIVAVDASAGESGTFGNVLTLVRHAMIDLGVHIRANLDDLRPDPETGLAPAHGVLCDINYPKVGDAPAAKGVLLVIKLSMTGNENELINAYRLAHPEFPNQSTLDQFFDEHQFEAFRQLGVHSAQSMLSEALVGEGEIQSVRDWLERLYRRIPPNAGR
jgi:predicted acylesterase/phospholipase RssA